MIRRERPMRISEVSHVQGGRSWLLMTKPSAASNHGAFLATPSPENSKITRSSAARYTVVLRGMNTPTIAPIRRQESHPWRSLRAIYRADRHCIRDAENRRARSHADQGASNDGAAADRQLTNIGACERASPAPYRA